MIYLRPGWIFQPCADSSRKLLDALDSTSFIPGSYSRSFGVYQLPLEGKIGKSFIGEFRNNIDGRLVRDTVYYFYARFVMNVQPGVDTVRMREICWYTLYDDTETYQLGCTLRDNEIEYIEPFRKEDQRNYIDFLNERNYPLPEWAQ